MKWFVIIGVALLSILAGCQSQPENSSDSTDVLEETASPENLPSFLEYYPDNIGNFYKGINDFQDMLEQLPSYDINGEPGELDNLYQSFIFEHTDEGSVIWNDHGARCNACIDSAAYSIEAWQNGTSIEEIREAIVTQYGEGNQAESSN
ncbi:PCYCGC motif-containing (lipo)protein [Alkalicoccobacillus murimartini]|uniref:Lipoprotein n=1 Tax=Alkalicoccobacillus murimartini TaxID=171685 RepID=A0ABT9YCG5_9BACI|nr:PCYCGC motif-containing (lipo)protein [Alkalicoccobacillus murimartini]MDQ0205318.1 hypothetical protein [Alkalicoccobacillus murimartini]